MQIRYTSHFARKLKKAYKHNSQLRKKVVKQVERFQCYPGHPSLKLHKLTGQRTEEYSIWIEGNLRITFLWEKEVVIFTDLITHDEY